MVDILVRNVDAEVAKRLKAKAAAKGTSVNETAREALTAYVTPDKAEAWAKADAIRKRSAGSAAIRQRTSAKIVTAGDTRRRCQRGGAVGVGAGGLRSRRRASLGG